MLIPHHAPVEVLAGKLAPFEVEGVAVAVARGVAVDADVAVLLGEPHLPVESPGHSMPNPRRPVRQPRVRKPA